MVLETPRMRVSRHPEALEQRRVLDTREKMTQRLRQEIFLSGLTRTYVLAARLTNEYVLTRTLLAGCRDEYVLTRQMSDE